MRRFEAIMCVDLSTLCCDLFEIETILISRKETVGSKIRGRSDCASTKTGRSYLHVGTSADVEMPQSAHNGSNTSTERLDALFENRS